jgi:hypothetical protein
VVYATDSVIKLFAKGGEGGPEHHIAHRLVNAWEFAKLAKRAADLGRYVIAVNIPYTILTISECLPPGGRLQFYSVFPPHNYNTRPRARARRMGRLPPRQFFFSRHVISTRDDIPFWRYR